MQEQELRRLLEKLHKEIESTNSVDEKGLTLLREIDADLHKLLMRSGADPFPPEEPLLKRLDDAIDHLEITHPSLTRALSDMLATLSNAGI